MGCRIIEKDYEWQGFHIGDLVQVKDCDSYIYEVVGFVEDEDDEDCGILIMTDDRAASGFCADEEVFDFNYYVSTTEGAKQKIILSGGETYRCRWEHSYDLILRKRVHLDFWLV